MEYLLNGKHNGKNDRNSIVIGEMPIDKYPKPYKKRSKITAIILTALFWWAFMLLDIYEFINKREDALVIEGGILYKIEKFIFLGITFAVSFFFSLCFSSPENYIYVLIGAIIYIAIVIFNVKKTKKAKKFYEECRKENEKIGATRKKYTKYGNSEWGKTAEYFERGMVGPLGKLKEIEDKVLSTFYDNDLVTTEIYTKGIYYSAGINGIGSKLHESDKPKGHYDDLFVRYGRIYTDDEEYIFSSDIKNKTVYFPSYLYYNGYEKDLITFINKDIPRENRCNDINTARQYMKDKIKQYDKDHSLTVTL